MNIYIYIFGAHGEMSNHLFKNHDPTIAIVPTGSSGWAGKDDKSNAEKPNAPSSNGQAKLETGNVVEQTQNLTNNFNQPQTNVPQQVK